MHRSEITLAARVWVVNALDDDFTPENNASVTLATPMCVLVFGRGLWASLPKRMLITHLSFSLHAPSLEPQGFNFRRTQS